VRGRDCRKDVRNPKKVIAKPRAPELALSLTPERLKDGQKGSPNLVHCDQKISRLGLQHFLHHHLLSTPSLLVFEYRKTPLICICSPVIIYGPEYYSFQVRFPCFPWIRLHLFVSSRVSFNFQGRRVRPALGRSCLATGAKSVLRKGGR
jgi:hypothetical protein